ncbi:MAG: multidrug effflux MFS transporter [Endozoicomonas sp. (ex Botrylloides leachii)]|nr:multidrug effflux MFS transporter [Endozoicomonas sp. (ex Botrylloides leachii)]
MRQLTPEHHSGTILAVLTLFAIVGPVSIDIFTPSLPAVTQYFETTHATSQWSVGIFMLGFSASMIICGPLADRLGRKKTLMYGYTLYLLATIIILQADNIYLFIGARFFQALFGCFGTAIARTIARDYYNDTMEVKMLAYISGCLTIAPMLAPIAGGFIQDYAGWRYNFVTMAVLAILALLVLQLLPERHTTTKTEQSPSILLGYLTVLTDLCYLRFTFAAGMAFAGAFVFVVGAPFVFIDQLQVSPKHYGFLFAVAIAGYIISAAYVPQLNKRFSRSICLKLSGFILFLGALISLLSGYLSQGQSIVGYMVGIFIYEIGLGVYMPVCQASATEHMKSYIGTASGLIFFIEMLLGTLISGIVGWLPAAGTLSLGGITLAAALCSMLCLPNTNRVD